MEAQGGASSERASAWRLRAGARGCGQTVSHGESDDRWAHAPSSVPSKTSTVTCHADECVGAAAAVAHAHAMSRLRSDIGTEVPGEA